MRFSDVLGRSEWSELSQIDAAELLGISDEPFVVGDRHRETGLAGLPTGGWHRRCGALR